MAAILIVDDRAVNREFLMTLLGYGNHVLFEAADGVQALKIIHQEHLDLVITDILMPNLNGYELAQKLQEDPELSKIPVIFYTATYKLTEANLLASDCGVKYVLTKPSEPDVIINTVNQALNIKEPILESKKMLSPAIKTTESNEFIRISDHISNYLSNMDSAKQALNNLIASGKDFKTERDQLIKISDDFSSSIDQFRRITGRLVTLAEFDLDLIAEHDTAKLIQLFCDGSRRILGSQYAVLGILENDANVLKHYFVSGKNLSEEAKKTPSKIDDGVIARILNDREVVKIDNADTLSDASILSCGHRIKTIIGAPLLTNTHLYGFVYYTDKEDGSPYNELDLNMINTLASELSIIYENIQLYELIQRHATKLQLAMTERDEAQKELINNEMLFRQFAENIKEVFWRMTPKMEQFTYVSPAYEEIWGRSSDSLYSHPSEWLESVIENDKEKVKLFFSRLPRRESASIEYRIRRPDGAIKVIFMKAFHVKDTKGKLINMIGIASDMTEFVQLKTQTYLNDKLMMMGRLATGIAHEINNPITWMLGNLEFAKDHVTTMDRFKLQKIINESFQGAERIRDIVQNLKGFARADAKEISSVDLHRVLDSVLAIAAHEIKTRATMETRYAKELPLIEANSGKLHQVFLNLIMNAAQAIPEGDVKNNKILITTAQQDQYVKIDICDTGSGIDPENLPKIFDPFFTTKSASSGTGLGLSISYEIVKSFDGLITVNSTLGKGSTFTVYLPLKSKMKSQPEEREEGAKSILNE